MKKFIYKPDTRKYPYQQCQDEKINEEFRMLHKNIINQVIQLCKKYNVTIDEIHLNADGVEDSIPFGSWQACTDSSFSLSKFTQDYKDVLAFRKKVSKEEFVKIKAEQEPFIVSM